MGQAMLIDRSQYQRGMTMTGAACPGGFVTAEGRARIWVGERPPALERKLPDPRLADVKARLAALAATEAKVELLKKRIEALAAQVKRR
jgi:hypothetical protein